MPKITKPTEPHELPVLEYTDEDAIQYLESQYGKLGKVFFDWRQDLAKDEANEPYVNMRALDQLIKLYQDGHLEQQAKVISLMFKVNEEDLNTLMTKVEQFEQTNSVVDKVQKFRESQATNPSDSNKNKPTN